RRTHLHGRGAPPDGGGREGAGGELPGVAECPPRQFGAAGDPFRSVGESETGGGRGCAGCPGRAGSSDAGDGRGAGDGEGGTARRAAADAPSELRRAHPVVPRANRATGPAPVVGRHGYGGAGAGAGSGGRRGDRGWRVSWAVARYTLGRQGSAGCARVPDDVGYAPLPGAALRGRCDGGEPAGRGRGCADRQALARRARVGGCVVRWTDSKPLEPGPGLEWLLGRAGGRDGGRARRLHHLERDAWHYL